MVHPSHMAVVTTSYQRASNTIPKHMKFPLTSEVSIADQISLCKEAGTNSFLEGKSLQ